MKTVDLLCEENLFDEDFPHEGLHVIQGFAMSQGSVTLCEEPRVTVTCKNLRLNSTSQRAFYDQTYSHYSFQPETLEIVIKCAVLLFKLLKDLSCSFKSPIVFTFMYYFKKKMSMTLIEDPDPNVAVITAYEDCLHDCNIDEEHHFKKFQRSTTICDMFGPIAFTWSTVLLGYYLDDKEGTRIVDDDKNVADDDRYKSDHGNSEH
ncbi:hypothetical protein L1987_41422 [Smallanthus sonchifolius]|uniref:Uncharacterized protein n=1 Tax=Smallanthus sonchifolius TaxID=185202 RepID=A0ACB9GUD6_9ASTR|nr:hypothetical protein L1987_41422 [Smallanthus sonchifolius]